MKLPKVIVGIDPGTTSGVAVLSLKGKFLAAESRRNFGRNEIVRYISSLGKPTIIATDRALAPSLVMKVSSSFNSIVFSPEEDLKFREKLEATRGFRIDDSHQRDALAAALFAYKKNEELLGKIERSVEGLNLWRYVDDVKDMILRGRCSNVAEAIDVLLSSERVEEDKKTSGKKEVTRVDMENIVGKLRGSLREKEKSFSILERYAEKLEERVRFLEEENERLRKRGRNGKVPKRIQHRISNLKGEIGNTREMAREKENAAKTLMELDRIRKNGLVPVKILDESTEECLKEMENRLGLHKDVLFFRSYARFGDRFLEQLKKKETEMVIGNFPENMREKMEREGIVVVSKGDVNISLGKRCGSISPESMKMAGKKNFMGWLKNYRKRSE